MHSGWGYSESPLVDGNKLVCTPGGPEAGIVALDKKTGREIWRCPIPAFDGAANPGAAYSSIVISNAAGVKQYVQLMGQGVVGVDASTGKFLWGYGRIANRTANIPTPLVHGDYVFCSSGYGAGAALLKLSRAAGGVKADEVYFIDGKDFQNHHGGMLMLGDYIYAGHGHNKGAPTCLEWKTGKTVWRHNRGPGSGSAAVSFADGNLYFRFEDGVMALIGATPDEYQEKGTFKIPGVEQPSWSHPVIAGGKLYLREQDALYCYDVSG
jgi:outer membrane protein assembly factor BamB